jgi:hypothetical protein
VTQDSKPSEPASMSTDQTSQPSGTEETNSRAYWGCYDPKLPLLFWLITLSSMYLYWNGYMTGIQALSLILFLWLVLYVASRLETH